MKLSVDDVLPIIYRFLIKSGFIKAAEQIQKAVDDDLSKTKLPLHKKKLMNIMKKYVKDFPELAKLPEEEPEISEQEEEPVVVEEVKPKKQKKKKAARKVSNISVSNLNDDVDENKAVSNGVLGKRKRTASIVSNTQVETPQLKPKKVKKSKAAKQEEQVQEEVEVKAPVKPMFSNPRLKINPVTSTNLNKRVKIESMGEVYDVLKNNSFEQKLAGGGVDEYGKFGQERLGGTQGKTFRKEKNK